MHRTITPPFWGGGGIPTPRPRLRRLQTFPLGSLQSHSHHRKFPPLRSISIAWISMHPFPFFPPRRLQTGFPLGSLQSHPPVGCDERKWLECEDMGGVWWLRYDTLFSLLHTPPTFHFFVLSHTSKRTPSNVWIIYLHLLTFHLCKRLPVKRLAPSNMPFREVHFDTSQSPKSESKLLAPRNMLFILVAGRLELEVVT